VNGKVGERNCEENGSEGEREGNSGKGRERSETAPTVISKTWHLCTGLLLHLHNMHPC